MRDDATRPTSDALPGPLPLAVIVQPDPMLDEQRPGPLRMVLTALGAVAVVCMVFYGLTRPEAPQQMAAAPSESETAPAGGGAANNAGGQAQPANAPAQNPQPNAQNPTTTGQGSGEHAGQPQSPPKGQAGQSKTPPAAGSSATSAVGPGAKPAPQAK